VKALLPLAAVAALIGGCGLDVQSPDLFLLTRTGSGPRLTLLVSDDGTISCDARPSKQLPGNTLIAVRDLTTSLNTDATHRLHIARTPQTVSTYTVRLQSGTISFPDTAARTHKELAQLVLFATQAAQSPCGLGG